MPSVLRSFLLFRRSLGVVTTGWRNLIKSIRDPYRPERYYMRGRGPKWHAKHSMRSAA
jgi:hypothetical protein